MRAMDLPRAERPTCAGCRAMVPEVEVPRGDGAIRCCWICAHAIVDHECEPEDAINFECACKVEEIYPSDVLALRAFRTGDSPLLCTGRTSYGANQPEPMPPRVVEQPATGRTHTLVSRCYNLDGTPDDGGPKLVQTFEEVRPGVVQLTSTTVREPTRGERMAKKQHDRQAAMRRNFGEPKRPA